MEIIHKIMSHLDRKEPATVIDAVQGETGRTVELSLFEKDLPWAVPADAHLAIRYGNLDRGAVYDTLADGQSACTWADNIVTFPLPPRLLANAGLTRVQLAITREGRTLATFAFHVRVEPDASAGTEDYADYVNLLPEFIKAAQEGAQAAQQAVAAAEIAATHEAAAGEHARDAANAVHEAYYAAQEAHISASNAQQAAQRAEAAAGSGGTAQLQPLKIYQHAFGISTLLDTFDGTRASDIDLQMGFQYYCNRYGGGHYLYQADGPAVFDGAFPSYWDSDDSYEFTQAYAFPSHDENGIRHLTVLDYISNTRYRFRLVYGEPTEVEQSPIFTAGGESGGNEWRLVKSITLEHAVSKIHVTTDDAGNPLNLNEAFMEWNSPQGASNTSPTQMSITGNKGSSGSFGLAFKLGESNTKAWFTLERFGDKLRHIYGGGKPSQSNDYVRASGTLLDIGKIQQIQLNQGGTDGIFAAGSTLKLYTRG